GRQADAAPRGAVHPLRRAALGSGAPPGARGGDRRRRAVAVREPVAARARIVRRRHANPGQRAQRGPRRALPQEQRRTLLCRSRRVQRGAEAARRRPSPPRGARRQRAALHQDQLPVGRDPGEVRKDVLEAAVAGPELTDFTLYGRSAFSPGASRRLYPARPQFSGSAAIASATASAAVPRPSSLPEQLRTSYLSSPNG